MTLNRKSSLHSRLWANDSHIWLHNLILLLIGIIFLTVSAKITIYFYPVPLSMQNLIALFLGMAYGWRLGGFTVVVYLLLGLFNIPVFSSSGAGFTAFTGQQGGYLIGLAVGAVVSGFLIERGWGAKYFTAGLAAVIGMSAMYISEVYYLQQDLGWSLAFQSGIEPFLFIEFLKILLLTFAIPLLWQVNKNVTNLVPNK